jgi:hypothetical protein
MNVRNFPSGAAIQSDGRKSLIRGYRQIKLAVLFQPVFSLSLRKRALAQPNSVAKIASPAGITMIAGPGKKSMAVPIRRTLAPRTAITTLRTIWYGLFSKIRLSIFNGTLKIDFGGNPRGYSNSLPYTTERSTRQRGMNVADCPEGQHLKTADVSPWHGIYQRLYDNPLDLNRLSLRLGNGSELELNDN